MRFNDMIAQHLVASAKRLRGCRLISVNFLKLLAQIQLKNFPPLMERETVLLGQILFTSVH